MTAYESISNRYGKLVSIWRYPVKSMIGEELNSLYITERGLIGDRTYPAIDDQKTGKFFNINNIQPAFNGFIGILKKLDIQ